MKSDDKIFFMRENISQRSVTHYLKTGKIIPLMQKTSSGEESRVNGVYLKAGMTKQERIRVVRQSALRIFKAIHGGNNNIMLSGPSALHLAPVKNILYSTSVSSSSQNKVIGNAFIISYMVMRKAGFYLEPRSRGVSDAKGSFSVNVMPDTMLFIQSFMLPRGVKTGQLRLKRSGLTNEDKTFLLGRLIDNNGSVGGVIHALTGAKKALGIGDATLHRAINFIKGSSQNAKPVFPDRRIDVIFKGERIGQILDFNQFMRFDVEQPSQMFSFIRSPSESGGASIPVYLETLLPERFVRFDEEERTLLHRLFFSGRRYLNSTMIASSPGSPIIKDEFSLRGRLDDHSDNRVFAGVTDFDFTGINARTSEIDRYYDVARRIEHPAIPGMQEKVACSLDDDGNLRFADRRAFTHILKLPGVGPRNPIAAGEWFCMGLLNAAGVDTVDCALIDIEGVGPSLLVERFDIATEGVKKDAVFEDFCSLLNVPIHRRYGYVDLTRIGEAIILNSAEFKYDVVQFFTQVIGSFLVGNMDAHARNFGMLTFKDRPTHDDHPFSSKKMHSQGEYEMRLAPAYDVVSTTSLPNVSPFPSLPMAGSMQYDMDSFVKFAANLNISEGNTRRVIKIMSEAMQRESERILSNLPGMLSRNEECVEHLKRIDARIKQATDFLLDDQMSEALTHSEQARNTETPKRQVYRNI